MAWGDLSAAAFSRAASRLASASFSSLLSLVRAAAGQQLCRNRLLRVLACSKEDKTAEEERVHAGISPPRSFCRSSPGTSSRMLAAVMASFRRSVSFPAAARDLTAASGSGISGDACITLCPCRTTGSSERRFY